MPIYEFVCSDCGTEYEKIVSFSATHYPVCPNCGSSEVTRRVGRPAIHFKGSGWYITDSKQSDRRAANGSGKAKNSDKGESAGESSETKKPEKTETAESSS